MIYFLLKKISIFMISIKILRRHAFMNFMSFLKLRIYGLRVNSNINIYTFFSGRCSFPPRRCISRPS